MNILYAGTPNPSAKILKALCDNPSINVVGVITKPDKAQKRGNKLVQSPVSIEAQNRNLNIFKPDASRKESIENYIVCLGFNNLQQH